jgi:formylglycine-generating enzyme required for sulfatase activity
VATVGAGLKKMVEVAGGTFHMGSSYCLRYRPAARQGGTVDTSNCHIGFRCVVRP